MDKRYLFFLVLAATIWLSWIKLMEMKYPPPPRAKKPAVAKKETKDTKPAEKQQIADAKSEDAEKAPAEIKPADPPEAVAEKAEPELRTDLELGKPHPADQKGKPEYYIYAKLTNRDAAVSFLELNPFLDETRKARFRLIGGAGPGSFKIVKIWRAGNREDRREESTGFDHQNWEVVSSNHEEIVFRNTAFDGVLEVTKRFTLKPDSPMIDMHLTFKSLTEEPVDDVIYEMTGGNDLPVEGKWYTRYYTQMVAALVPTNGAYPYLQEQTSADVAGGSVIEYSQTPLQYAGVSNQYFASLVIQSPNPRERRLIASATPIDFDAKNQLVKPQLHNIGVRIASEPVSIRPDRPVEHSYLLFNGPKSEELLNNYAEYHLPLVIHYQDFLYLPIGLVARTMVNVLEFFHSLVGDYGIAIIMLTILVRGCMFPLSFKQAMSMQKMQALSPQLQELKEKYGKDKERLQRETMALYSKANVNPLMGCLPMLIQFPIFIGLWQALSNSFSLRQSSFFYGLTWIHDLAAPDQLFRFPLPNGLPFLGPYFNLLPVLAVVQMILQAKYMSPPATTPEMELQKKMMSFMMIFFGFLFYNMPAGLVVYIIASGAWSLAERLLLPKPQSPPQPIVSKSTSSPTPKETPPWGNSPKKKRKSRR